MATMSHQREYQTEGKSYKEIQTDSLELQSSVTAVDPGLDSEIGLSRQKNQLTQREVSWTRIQEHPLNPTLRGQRHTDL